MAGKRKFTCDYNYFENIDTEEKAYWLGFIMADGCICRYERIRHLKTIDSLQIRQYLEIAISCKDYNHLVKFSKSLNSTYPIHIYKTTGFDSSVDYCRIIIEDKKMVDDLINQGIDYNKSLCKKYPSNLNSKFDLAFIRGIFDGDGCLSSSFSRHGTPSYEFSLCSTKELLTSVAEKLNLIITDKTLKQRFPERNVNNYSMKFSGNLQTYRVMNLLYENANIYLDRKYEKYLELCNYINSRSI